MALDCKRSYEDAKIQQRKSEKEAWKNDIKVVLHKNDPFNKIKKDDQKQQEKNPKRCLDERLQGNVAQKRSSSQKSSQGNNEDGS